MSMTNNSLHKQLTESQVNKLDQAASNYYLKQALYYIAEAHASNVATEERNKKTYDDSLAKLVEKQQAENKIQPFLSCVKYELYELGKTWKPEDGLHVVEEAYKRDKLLVEKNLETLTKNSEIINNVVKALEIVGLEKTTYKYLRANAKTKTAVTSEWYLELVNKCANLSFPKGYSENDLTKTYQEFHRRYLDYKNKQSELEKEKIEADLREAKLKENLQREAVLVAHACIKYSLSPLEVTTREILDKKLEEKGLLPSKVIQDLEFELF